MFESLLTQYFQPLGVALSKSFVRYTSATISAGSSRTHEIARHMSLASGKDFNTSEKRIDFFRLNRLVF